MSAAARKNARRRLAQALRVAADRIHPESPEIVVHVDFVDMVRDLVGAQVRRRGYSPGTGVRYSV
jgi:hypothetical protein